MIYCFIIALLVVAIDQLSKFLVMTNMDIHESIVLWDGVLNLTRIPPNKGAAFGMLSDNRWIFMVLSVVAITAIIIYLVKEKPKSYVVRTCLAAVLGGGIGNMIDRIVFGGVTDFVDFTFTDFFFFGTVFNVADIFVTVGCVTLVLYMLIVEFPKEAKKSKTAKALESDSTENEQ